MSITLQSVFDLTSVVTSSYTRNLVWLVKVESYATGCHFEIVAHLCVPIFRGVADLVEVGASQSKPFGVFIGEILKPYGRKVREVFATLKFRNFAKILYLKHFNYAFLNNSLATLF